MSTLNLENIFAGSKISSEAKTNSKSKILDIGTTSRGRVKTTFAKADKVKTADSARSNQEIADNKLAEDEDVVNQKIASGDTQEFQAIVDEIITQPDTMSQVESVDSKTDSLEVDQTFCDIYKPTVSGEAVLTQSNYPQNADHSKAGQIKQSEEVNLKISQQIQEIIDQTSQSSQQQTPVVVDSAGQSDSGLRVKASSDLPAESFVEINSQNASMNQNSEATSLEFKMQNQQSDSTLKSDLKSEQPAVGEFEIAEEILNSTAEDSQKLEANYSQSDQNIEMPENKSESLNVATEGSTSKSRSAFEGETDSVAELNQANQEHRNSTNLSRDKSNSDVDKFERSEAINNKILNDQNILNEQATADAAQPKIAKSEMHDVADRISRQDTKNLNEFEVSQPVVSDQFTSEAISITSDDATTARVAAVDQIVTQLSVAKINNAEQMTIQLSPEDLGFVKVQLTVEAGELKGVIEVENSKTYEDLSRQGPELIAKLTDAGLTVKDIDFQMSDPGKDDSQKDFLNQSENQNFTENSSEFEQGDFENRNYMPASVAGDKHGHAENSQSYAELKSTDSISDNSVDIMI